MEQSRIDSENANRSPDQSPVFPSTTGIKDTKPKTPTSPAMSSKNLSRPRGRSGQKLKKSMVGSETISRRDFEE
eukprot:1393385-Amorphochlora_amoeboformis.AAC.2